MFWLKWSPDGSILLVGLADGDVHALDSNGNFMVTLSITLKQNITLFLFILKSNYSFLKQNFFFSEL